MTNPIRRLNWSRRFIFNSEKNITFNPIFGKIINFPSRKWVVGLIFAIALFAFEIFNFDTTRYALTNVLGDVTFAGIRWAAILAVAFCAIDFAGLAHLFTPENRQDESPAVLYLMGAWLLGATMNALMTWWAVSVSLLEHPLGNEVLSRQQLLTFVPIFVAALVWLTRILFIGALSVYGDHIFQAQPAQPKQTLRLRRQGQPQHRPNPMTGTNIKQNPAWQIPATEELPTRIERTPHPKPVAGISAKARTR